MKFALSVLFVLAATGPARANKKPVQDCKVRFAVVYIDRLDNINRGLQGKHLQDVQKKLSDYGDVCYTADEAAADYVFFIHTKPAIYHGVRTTSDTSTHTNSNPVSGTITDQDGETSTISGTVDSTTTTTTESSVPYEVDYSVFILNVLIPHMKEGSTDRTYSTLRTFDQKGLYHTMYGIGYGKGKHPLVTVVDAAAKWLHENNLGR